MTVQSFEVEQGSANELGIPLQKKSTLRQNDSKNNLHATSTNLIQSVSSNNDINSVASNFSSGSSDLARLHNFQSSPRGPTSSWTAMFTCLTAAIGSGIMEIPNAIAACGWVYGILGCLFVNGFIAFSAGYYLSKAIFLAETVKKQRIKSFGEVAEVVFGKAGKYAIRVLYHGIE